MKNQLRTVLLLGLLSALLVGVGSAIAPDYVYLFGAMAVVMNLGAYFFSDRLVLATSGAKPLGQGQAPRLHAMVRELAVAAGIPTPRLYLVPEAQPNAFATGRDPEHGVVAVTEGILALLSERELRGVLAHEIAHIKNRDILVASIAAAMGSVVTSVANALSFAALFGSSSSDDEEGGGSPFLLALAAPIAAMLIQMGISRSREYLADETGARLAGDAEGLARALEKLEQAARMIPATAQPATASLFIVNPLAGASSLLNLLSTHPPMAERIRRLRAAPPWTGGRPRRFAA